MTAGLAMYDTMQYIRSNQHSCVGLAASGSLLLMAGEKGKRIVAEFENNDPPAKWRFQRWAEDIEIYANDIIATRKRLNELYAQHCGRTMEEIDAGMDRDNYMTPDEALAFGLIDSIETKRGAQDEGAKRNGRNGMRCLVSVYLARVALD